MKKALSVILSVLVIFSMLGMAVSAADDGLVNIQFVIREEGKEDVVLKELNVAPGINIVSQLADLEDPVKEPADGVEYIFKCWENAANGHQTSTSNIPPAGETDVVYVAVFAEQEIRENQSFWAFIESIFERINMIFEYFAKVFEGVLEF